MPTYKYECNKCGHQFERFQSMMDEPVKRCPKCKGKVSRLLSAGVGVIFKGKGFYQTDYKGSGPEKKEKAESKDKTPPCPKAGSCPGCSE